MERRRGRRDNGIDAADFAAVGDLDPRLAEHLLDLLGARGIAAYLQPSMDVNPITRSSTVPARPTDRLYADRAHLGTARDFLRQLVSEETAGEPGQHPLPDREPEGGSGSAGAVDPADRTGGRPPATDRPPVDATFEGIVAGFDQPVDPTAASWPAAENLSGAPNGGPADGGLDPPPEPAPRPVDARQVTEPSLLDALDTFGADLPDPPEERYVPPPPPPLPRLSRQTVLGALALLVGLTLVLAPGLGPFGRGDSIMIGFAAMLGGAAALVLRLRPGTGPDEEQHPDDGARV